MRLDIGVVIDRVIAARDLVVARARDTGDALAEVDPRRKLVDQPGLEIGLRDVAARRGDDLRRLGEKRRSEECRGVKECGRTGRSRWSAYHYNKQEVYTEVEPTIML